MDEHQELKSAHLALFATLYTVDQEPVLDFLTKMFAWNAEHWQMLPSNELEASLLLYLELLKRPRPSKSID